MRRVTPKRKPIPLKCIGKKIRSKIGKSQFLVLEVPHTLKVAKHIFYNYYVFFVSRTIRQRVTHFIKLPDFLKNATFQRFLLLLNLKPKWDKNRKRML